MHKNDKNFADVMDAVRWLIDSDLVTVKRLASWCGADERTIYNWRNRKGEPSSGHVNLWLRHSTAEVKLHLAVAQLAGSGLTISPAAEATETDLLGKSISALQAGVRLLTTVNDARSDGLISVDERERIRAEAIAVRQCGDQVIAATGQPAGMRIA